MCWHIFSPIITKLTRKAECVCLESNWGTASTQGESEGDMVACGCPLLQKYSSPGEDDKFPTYESLHMCRLLFQLFTPLIHIYKQRQQALGGMASQLSVGRFLTLSFLGTGRHIHSCFNTAIYVWKLRQAGFIRHGVRRKHRVISWRTRTPCVRGTRWVLFQRLTEVQVFLKEGKRDVLFHLRSG